MKFIKIYLIMIIIFLTACSNMQGIKTHEPIRGDGNKPLKIAIFLMELQIIRGVIPMFQHFTGLLLFNQKVKV